MSMGVLRAGESCLFQFVLPYPTSFVTEENRSFSHDVTAAIIVHKIVNRRPCLCTKKSCGNWTLFTCKNFHLFQAICKAADHVTENDLLGRVEIAAVRVGVRAKEGGRGGERESKYGFSLFSPWPLTAPLFDSSQLFDSWNLVWQLGKQNHSAITCNAGYWKLGYSIAGNRVLYFICHSLKCYDCIDRR